jgi:hypothetical protein
LSLGSRHCRAGRAVYDALPDADLAAINAIISRLEADPWEDEETMLTIVLAGEVMGVNDDSRWELPIVWSTADSLRLLA